MEGGQDGIRHLKGIHAAGEAVPAGGVQSPSLKSARDKAVSLPTEKVM